MDRHTNSAFERLEIVETGRRRRWSEAAKERIALESLSGPRQISATARRHNISRSLLLIWRRAFLARNEEASPSFVPAVVTAEPIAAPQAVTLMPRTEIVLRCGRRIVVEGPVDIAAVLALARGLEALR
ncbi:transposase [Bosea eneae]|uniref:Transposase n=1 Tax=Bosea eneae TaxID=151454 RepID=A0ABW0J1Q0_9HYPH